MAVPSPEPPTFCVGGFVVSAPTILWTTQQPVDEVGALSDAARSVTP